MDSFSNIFSLIPVKIFFIASILYLWGRFFRLGKLAAQSSLPRLALGGACLGVVLGSISIGKIYPYGVITDLLLFLIPISLAMAIPGRSMLARIFVTLISFLPFLGPLVYILHYQVVGGAVDKDSFIAVFQTTSDEAVEYVASFSSVMSVLTVISFFGLICWIIGLDFAKVRLAVRFRVVTSLVLPSLFILYVVPSEKSLFNSPLIAFDKYKSEIEVASKRFEEYSRIERNTSFNVTKSERGEVYVVVVGESLNKHHMSLYGYSADTTPALSKLNQEDELYFFRNSYSNYPGTMAALSHALSSANQRNNVNFSESIGVLSVFNNADFDTYWIGNQPLSNSYDMILGFIAKAAQHVELTFDVKFHGMSHKNQKPDGVLLPLFEKVIANRDLTRNQVIFVHLMGNHTNYCERYPKEFERYKISLSKKIWMQIFNGGTGHSIECYDNSVLYNDYVVSSLIEILKSGIGGESAGGLMYFADHADDVDRGVGHSTSNFSFDMVESPAMVWLSDGYKNKYPELLDNLRSNIDSYYSNDFVFDTVIGMAGLEMNDDHYCASCDAFNKSYSLPLESAMTRHGEVLYKPVSGSPSPHSN